MFELDSGKIEPFNCRIKVLVIKGNLATKQIIHINTLSACCYQVMILFKTKPINFQKSI